jgi:hypothetical protein
MTEAALPSPLHRRRLRDIWRSAGWPCCDMVEVELLAAGWVERVQDVAGRETLRVTDRGVALLAQTLAANRAVRDAHEALVARVSREMQRAGRIVWRGLALRAQVDGEWGMAMPDVFSIRHTTREDAVEPVVHEVKVRRADLLADLRRPAKGAAYRELSSQCWYVLREGIATADEIPAVYGVMVASEGGIDVARPAPRRACRPPFHLWMALARATPEPVDDAPPRWLGDEDPDGAQSLPPL